MSNTEYVCRKCGSCGDWSQAKKEPRLFRNGTAHIEASCPDCGSHLQFLRSDEDPQFPFGRYKGKRVRDVIEQDPAYCRWMLDNVRLSGSVRHVLEEWAGGVMTGDDESV